MGLLVRTTGRVTWLDGDGQFFYLDDGSGLSDGNSLGPGGQPIIGLRVDLKEGHAMPEAGSQVIVTGVSALHLTNSTPAPLIRAVSTSGILPLDALSELVYVPDGQFQMGNTGQGWDEYSGFSREYPLHTVWVSGYLIGKYEVTRGQYRRFIEAGGYSNPKYWSSEGWAWRQSSERDTPLFWEPEQQFARIYSNPPGVLIQTDDHPVIGVTFYEAEAFANWVGARLPTEAEWEKAARWDGTPRVYPWGNFYDRERSNNWYDTIFPGFQTAPVGSFPDGESPSGAQDMAGNVWEWTADWLKSHPGNPAEFDLTGKEQVLKGGSWHGIYGTRAAARFGQDPSIPRFDTGFRIAR